MCMEGSVYGVSRVGQPSASQVARDAYLQHPTIISTDAL